MAMYKPTGGKLLTGFDAEGNELQRAYDGDGQTIHYGGAYLSIGTVGCGPICAIYGGVLLDIGDGDTADNISYNNITASMTPMPEVTYG